MGEFSLQAYQSYKNAGEDALERGDYENAKRNFAFAAKTANDIADKATQQQIGDQYRMFAKRMLDKSRNCGTDKVPSVMPKIKEEPRRKETKQAVIDKNLQGFQDIAGLEDVKTQIKVKVVYPLKYPNVIRHYKRSESNTMQIMLYGPPGTGKTMFAEAICVELGMSMHRKSASDLIGSYLGESSRNLDEFLSEAQADTSERILIFIDEFDAIATKRGDSSDGATSEVNRMVNTLLQGVDNIVKTNQDKLILFVVTTNLPWAIDPALLRGQRFDTQIHVGLPDSKAAKWLVEKHLGVAPLASDVDLNELANKLSNTRYINGENVASVGVGYSAADIKTICEKIAERPITREFLSLESNEGKIGGESQDSYIDRRTSNANEKITREDVEYVLSNYRNSITEEMIDNYDRYLKGEEVNNWG